MNYIILLYKYIFGRPFFFKFNRKLIEISLNNIGILNYEDNYFNGEERFIKKIGKDLKVVFDVGCNIGSFTQKLLKINDNLKVYSFEPHPLNFKEAKNNLKEYSNKISLINKGVGEFSSKLNLYDYENKDASSHASFYKKTFDKIHLSKNTKSFEIEVISLDEFCTENKIENIDFLKIDTEGFEMDVLKGAKNILAQKKIKIIQFEFNSMQIFSQTTLTDFLIFLKDYNKFRIMPGGKLLELSQNELTTRELFTYQNIIAILK